MNRQQLEDSLPICPSCGFWWAGNSEACRLDHKPDFQKYKHTLREIAVCKFENYTGTAAPTEDDRHIRGTD